MVEASELDTLSRAGLRNALGIVGQETGHYSGAAAHYPAAGQVMTTEVGPDHFSLAGIHHHLAGSAHIPAQLAHIPGQYEEAAPQIRTALALRARADPADPIGKAADFSVLGAVPAGQGRLEETEAALDEAHDLWEAQYGNEHYEIAVVGHNLIALLEQQQRRSEALEHYDQALTVFCTTLGGNHPDTRVCAGNREHLITATST